MLRYAVSLYLFVAVLMGSFFTSYVISKLKTNQTKAFFALGLGIDVYIFGYLMEINATSPSQAMFWNGVEYLSIPFFAVFWVLIAHLYTNRIHRLKKYTAMLLFFIPFTTLVLRFTNHLHHLYYSAWMLQPFGSIRLLHLAKGPWYYVQFAYTLILLLSATLIFFLEYVKSDKLERRRYRSLFIVSVIPYAGLIFNTLDPHSGLDYAALLLPLCVLMMMYAVQKQDFMEVNVLAHDTVFRNSRDGMVLLDSTNHIMDCNKAAREYLVLMDLPSDGVEDESCLEALINLLGGAPKKVLHSQIAHEHFYWEISATPMLNDFQRSVGTLVTIRDVTETEKLQQKLKAYANTDTLTRLNNRRYFMKLAAHEWNRAKRYGHGFCLIMLDLDHFKLINDTYGHAAGDVVLQELGGLMKASFRTTDICGRLGGEEFVVMLTNTEQEDAKRVAEQFRRKVEQFRMYHEGNELSITISIGIAPYYEGANSLEAIIRNSDKALYLSKFQGRNCVSVVERE